jgi:hypothetical protein
MKSLYAYHSDVNTTKDFTSKEEAEFSVKYKVGYKNMAKEKRKRYPQEAHIHNIIWRAFDRVNEDNTFMVEQESGLNSVFSSSGEYINGTFSDFRFTPICAKDGTNFVFELKTEQNDRKGLLYNSLLGLGQIFGKNYHKSILPLKSTESIVSIGIAANTTHINLAILDIKTLGGNYISADKIICMAFKVTKSDNGTIGVDHPYILEANISINETSPFVKAEKKEVDSLENTEKEKADSQENTEKVNEDSPKKTGDEKDGSRENTDKENKDSPEKTVEENAGSSNENENITNSPEKVRGKPYSLQKSEKNDTNKDPYGNDAIRGNICSWILDLMENPSIFNVSYIQSNTTKIPPPPKRRINKTPKSNQKIETSEE